MQKKRLEIKFEEDAEQKNYYYYSIQVYYNERNDDVTESHVLIYECNDGQSENADVLLNKVKLYGGMEKFMQIELDRVISEESSIRANREKIEKFNEIKIEKDICKKDMKILKSIAKHFKI